MQLLQNKLGHCSANCRDSLLNEIENCQNELDKFYEIKSRRAIVRSRARWAEMGERNTKYFLNLEKSGYQRRSINEIKTSTGSVVSVQNAILYVLKGYFEKFYQKVSTAECSQIDEYLGSVQTPCLSESERQPRLAQITKQECLNILNNVMSNNKSPGSNGFSAEFYKYFWKDYHIMLLNYFKFSFEIVRIV